MGGTTLVRDEPAVAPSHAPDPPPTAPAGLGPRRVRLVFAGLTLALLLAALEQMIVATALPRIAGELHGADRMSWAITAYLLTATVGLPVYGKLGDLLGRKGVFQFAVLVFVAGSALAGRARTMEELIAFRAVQGAGAGGLLTGVQAITADIVPPRSRGRYLGLIGAAFGLASVAGPLLGGWLTDQFSWRWCFYVNVPFGLVTLAVVSVVLRLPKPARRARLDVPGTLLLAALSACLVLLTAWGGTRYAWDSRQVALLAAGALVCAALFPVAERLAAEPLVPLRLFRDSVFNVTNLVGLVAGAALFGAVGYLPTFLQMAHGVSATGAGLLMLPMTGGIVGASVLTGQLVSLTGRYKPFPLIGSALAATGMWLLSRLDADTPRLHFALWTAVLGTGIGMVMPVLVLAVQNSVRPADLGTATSASNYFRQIGGSAGAALFGALFTARLTDILPTRADGAPLPDPRSLTPQLVHALPPALRDTYARAYADAMPHIFLFLVPVLLMGLLLSCFLKEGPLPARHTPAEPVHDTIPPDTEHRDTVPLAVLLQDTVPLDAAIPQARTPLTDALTVHGAVRHRDGTGVPRATLTLVDAAGRQTGRAESDADGGYALTAPGRGPYVLIAAAAGHQPQAVLVSAEGGPVELDVVLDGTGRLGGSVRTPDGSPVPDATVTLTDAHGEVTATTRSGRDGGYTLDDITAGEYTLAAGAPALRPTALPVTVRAARATRQDAVLTGGAVLRGTVRTGAGRPVEDARVTLHDALGNPVDTFVTGPDGTYRFADLTTGEYTVVATGYPPVATVLHVPGGVHTEHDLRLGHEDGTDRTDRRDWTDPMDGMDRRDWTDPMDGMDRTDWTDWTDRIDRPDRTSDADPGADQHTGADD
ncbi:MFS transporter [Streptomyces sp. YIM S03343]